MNNAMKPRAIVDIVDNAAKYIAEMRRANDVDAIPNELKGYIAGYIANVKLDRPYLEYLAGYFIDKIYTEAEHMARFDKFTWTFLQVILPRLYEPILKAGINTLYILSNEMSDDQLSIVAAILWNTGFKVVTPYVETSKQWLVENDRTRKATILVDTPKYSGQLSINDVENEIKEYMQKGKNIVYIETNAKVNYLNEVCAIGKNSNYLCVLRSAAPQDGYAQTISGSYFDPDNDRWIPSRIYEYTNSNTNAVENYSRAIAQHHRDDCNSVLNIIKATVTEKAGKMSDAELAREAFVIAEDLYKTANHITIWDSYAEMYLRASAGTFFTLLRDRGYLLQYLIDNSAEETELGYQRPTSLNMMLFNSSGFTYICPQEIALRIMWKVKLIEDDKFDEEKYFFYLPKYITEARLIATDVVKDRHKDKWHYVLAEYDNKASLNDYMQPMLESTQGTHGIITLYRSEAPTKGSKCSVMFPKDLNVSMG